MAGRELACPDGVQQLPAQHGQSRGGGTLLGLQDHAAQTALIFAAGQAGWKGCHLDRLRGPPEQIRVAAHIGQERPAAGTELLVRLNPRLRAGGATHPQQGTDA